MGCAASHFADRQRLCGDWNSVQLQFVGGPGQEQTIGDLDKVNIALEKDGTTLKVEADLVASDQENIT